MDTKKLEKARSQAQTLLDTAADFESTDVLLTNLDDRTDVDGNIEIFIELIGKLTVPAKILKDYFKTKKTELDTELTDLIK